MSWNTFLFGALTQESAKLRAEVKILREVIASHPDLAQRMSEADLDGEYRAAARDVLGSMEHLAKTHNVVLGNMSTAKALTQKPTGRSS
jgi:hypothetical protein